MSSLHGLTTYHLKTCPECNSKNIERDAIQVSLSQRIRYMRCNDCDCTFRLKKNKIVFMRFDE